MLAIAPPASGGRSNGAVTPRTAQTVFVSPIGKDNTCARGVAKRPCSTLGRAYVVAHPGDTVSIAGGTYTGKQVLRFDPSKPTAPVVTFAPAPGQQVIIDGNLHFDGSSFITINGDGRLRVRDMGADLFDGHRPSHLTITGLRAYRLNNTEYPDPVVGANYFNSVDHLTLRNVEIGPTCCQNDGLDIAIGNNGDPVPANIVLDRVYIHDVELDCSELPAQSRAGCNRPPSDQHVDCLQFFGGINVVIENSRFFGCSESAVMTGSANGGKYSNWTIQNNLFGPLVHPDNGVDISDGGPANSPWSGSIRILHNTFADGENGPALIFAQGAGVFQPGTTAYIAGNANGLSRLCLPGTTNLSVTFEWNMWGNYKCGQRDVRGAITFVRSSVLNPDLRLGQGSAGIGAVAQTIGPPFDANGRRRPRFWKADAGALQREPAVITLGMTVGSVSLGMSSRSVDELEGSAPTTGRRNGILTTTYRRFGGRLSVWYANGTVVGAGTTSSYYSTSSGLAVGQSSAGLTKTAGWRTCQGGVRRTVGGRIAVATIRRGRIASIWNVRVPFADELCKRDA